MTMTKQKKQELSVRGIERGAIEWVQKHEGDLLTTVINMGGIEWFEARLFAQKAYRAGFADALLLMGVWPIEYDNKKMREVLKRKSLKYDRTNESR